MSEDSPSPKRLAGSIIIVLSLLLWVSLGTYDPADGPEKLVFPPNPSADNALGAPGALLSSLLFNAFGLAAFYVPLCMTTGGIVLIRVKRTTYLASRLIGVLMTMIGASTLMAMTLADGSIGPVIGPGGYLGATSQGLLTLHFLPLGAMFVSVALLAAGVILSSGDLVGFTLSVLSPRVRERIDYLASIVSSEARSGMSEEEDKCAEEAADAEQEWEEYEEEVKENAAEEEADEGLRVVRPTGKKGSQSAAEGLDAEQGRKKKLTRAEKKQLRREEQQRKEQDRKKAQEEELRVIPPRKAAKSEEEQLREELDAVDHSPETIEFDYELPSIEMLEASEEFCFEEHEKAVRRQAKTLEKTFADFGFNVRVVEIQTGPVISQFEVQLERGLRLSKITGLADDLAIALKVQSVRIVAPIPGKNTVGIEVPNQQRQLVRLREVMEETLEASDSAKIPIFLGKDVAGNPMVIDLAALPHLLIAGRTGTGKSVCLNSLIVSMLMTRRPDEVRMLLIDPKMVELSPYKTIPHLMHPVVTHMPKAEAILAWAVEKMEERYTLLAKAGVRHLSVYNQLGEEELHERMKPETEEEWEQIPKHMPYIVIVADEMADLMMTAAKEVETHIIRLAQKSRAVGIHLVLATQKPTVDIITGLIKSNLPARIAFEVASRTDSRVVLDEMGADKLLGNGDMLFLRPGTSSLIRGQGTYVSDAEINDIIDAVATSEPQFVKELVQLETSADADSAASVGKDRDAIYQSAVEVVIREGRGSVSLLQRSLGVGYGRAARMIDHMAEDGIVGPYAGSQAREVVMSLEEWNQASGAGGSDEDADKSNRKNTRIQLRSVRDVADEEADSADAEDDDGATWDEQDDGWEYEYEEADEASDEYEEDAPFESNVDDDLDGWNAESA